MKKRIAILSFYSGKHKRGVESWVSGLEKYLSKDFDIKIYSFKNTRHDINWQIPQEKTSLGRKLYLDYWSLCIFKFNFLLIPKLIKFKPQIILATDGGWESRIMRIFTWITGAKLVIAGQSGIGWDEYNNIYSFPDCFVALTKKAEKWACKYNPLIKVIKIPNAIDTTLFTKIDRKLNKTKQILTIGALEKGKRMHLIIKAISKIKNVELTIIGEGYEKDSLKKLAKNLGVNLTIKSVSHRDIVKELHKADLFVSASESYYAFEIVLIEAMAANLPVVANDDEIRREIIGKAGILSKPEETEKFTQDIQKALNINWSDMPRKQSKNFSWDIVSGQYIKLFNQL